MNSETTRRVRLALLTCLLAEVLFLPLAIAGSLFELWCRGTIASVQTLNYQLGASIVTYASAAGAVLLGAAIYSGTMAILSLWPESEQRGWLAIALAPIVPGTVIAFRLSAWSLFTSYPWPSVVATIAFGAACGSLMKSLRRDSAVAKVQ
jgi:hypothetical protein